MPPVTVRAPMISLAVSASSKSQPLNNMPKIGTVNEKTDNDPGLCFCSSTAQAIKVRPETTAPW